MDRKTEPLRNRFLKVKIYSRELDGPQILDAFEPKLDGDSEFLMKGYGAEDRYHEWYLAYFLRTSKSGRYFALETIDYGDPQEKSEKGYCELAVVVEDPEASDLPEISNLLIAEYESSNSKTIRFVDQSGEEDPKE